jgi:hypothetical protein
MRNSLVMILVSLLLLNCSENNDSSSIGVACYKFRNSDLEKLLPYVENQIIVFKNQNGEERKFKVSSVDKNYRKSYLTSGIGIFTNNASVIYDYDQKQIAFEEFPSAIKSFEINVARSPINYELAKSNNITEYPSIFSGGIQYFPYWNGEVGSKSWEIYIPIDYSLGKTNLSCNGVEYNDVLFLKSNNNQITESNNPNYVRNVNILFFDEKKGLIGFDDLDGKEWRLQ